MLLRTLAVATLLLSRITEPRILSFRLDIGHDRFSRPWRSVSWIVP
jgi:hypothetical protein